MTNMRMAGAFLASPIGHGMVDEPHDMNAKKPAIQAGY
jgi:hypothetical protein